MATKKGQRYSKRIEDAHGCTSIDPDVFHYFRGSTVRYREWAARYLAIHDIDAETFASAARLSGHLDEGAALREHVQSIKGVDVDSGVWMAARIFQLCSRIDVFMKSPELFRPGEGFQDIFELGRMSMMARVYQIDEVATEKRVKPAAKSRSVPAGKVALWKEWRNEPHLKHKSDRSAAEIIERREEGRFSAETIRKSFKKLGTSICETQTQNYL